MNAVKKASQMKFIRLAVLVAIGTAAHTAFAALGGAPLTGADPHVASSAMTDALTKASTALQVSAASASVNAPATPAANAAYRVNVVTLDSGTVVREFVASSTNTVFAVTWSGQRAPNFADILGTYSQRYLKPSGSDLIRVGGLRQRGLNSSDLVVQSFGHFGQFIGYAYLPSAVPAGLSLTDIQ
ncbi:MAG TPA: DUF2844 domain-containing protein [Paraburkholderia sp.]|jgi:hypothetical protein|nr:DUF2844 domain-containing protein [Paraburkholderia sp.]